jgi:hypothetical protein
MGPPPPRAPPGGMGPPPPSTGRPLAPLGSSMSSFNR